MPDPQPPIVLPQNTIVGPLVPQWKGIMKIIDAEAVESHTHDGWVVLGSFEVKNYVEAHGQEPRMVPYSEGYYNSNGDATVPTARPIQVSSWQFIVGKDEASIIGEKTECIASLERELQSAKERTDTLTKEVEAERQRVASAEGNSNYYREESQKARDQISGRDERIRKMEDDLGKIRAAFGDLKIREILSEGKADGG